MWIPPKAIASTDLGREGRLAFRERKLRGLEIHTAVVLRIRPGMAVSDTCRRAGILMVTHEYIAVCFREHAC
jgi:hypothetical protein